jgi:ATP-dependent RNA helicase DeaD
MVVHKELTVPNVQQFYYELKPNMKLEILSRLIDVHDPKLSLVFCNTKRAVDGLVSQLQARGYAAEAIHGDLKQNQRDKVMAKFRNGKLEVLVATDVAARGIDVDDIDAVFNYDMPQDEEYYVHRIGRTARAGKSGHSHTFVVGKEFHKIRDIERFTKSKITRKDPPSSADVAELRTSTFIDEIKAAIGDGSGLSKYDQYLDKLADQDFTTFEIAAGLMKLLLSKEEAAVKQAEELSKSESHSYEDKNDRGRDRDRGTDHKDRDHRDRKDKGYGKDRDRGFSKERSFGKDKSFSKDRSYGKEKSYSKEKSFGKDRGSKSGGRDSHKTDSSMERLFVNVGRKSNIGAKDILGAFVGETGIPGKSIGGIDIYDKFTFVEVDKKHVKEVIEVMNDNQIKGQTIAVEIAKGRE